MGIYNISLAGATANTSNDSLTFVTAASGQDSRFHIVEVFFGGESASASKVRFHFDRSTGGTTPGGAAGINPLDENGESGAEILLNAYTTWAAQPTLSGNRVLTPLFEGAGGQYRWFAVPGRAIVVGTGAAAKNLSIRAGNGGGTSFTSDVKIERI